MFSASKLCQGSSISGPSAAVTGDQVVVYWYEGAHLFNPRPLPTDGLPPGSLVKVFVDGSPAIETSGDSWFKWQLNAVGYIEGRWGPDAQDGQTQAASLLASIVLDR